MLTTPNFVAGADIYPCRLVSLKINGTTGVGMTVLQATAGAGTEGDYVIGVSQEGTKKFDSALAAASGDQLEVHGPGHYALVEAGGTITAGAALKPTNATGTTAGKAIVSTTDKDKVAGFALMDASSGEKFWMIVHPFTLSV